MSDVPFDGWWRAADGRWYPPETHPAFNPPGPQTPPPGWWKGGDDKWYPPHLHPDHTDDSERSERVLHRRALALTWVAVLVFAGAVAVFLIRDGDTPPVQVDGETVEQSIPPATAVNNGTLNPAFDPSTDDSSGTPGDADAADDTPADDDATGLGAGSSDSTGSAVSGSVP